MSWKTVLTAAIFFAITIFPGEGSATAPPVTGPGPVRVDNIRITAGQITMEVGQTITITGMVSPANATEMVGWMSMLQDETSGEGVARVIPRNPYTSVREGGLILHMVSAADHDGTLSATIQAVSEGETAIILSSEGGSVDACLVTVVPATGARAPAPDRVSNVTLNRTAITISPEETAILTATVEPRTATDRRIRWTTSDAGIVQVTLSATDPFGAVIRGMSRGTATVTVTTLDGNRTATCRVTVGLPTIPVRTVNLDQKEVTIGPGETFILNARVVPENATNQGVLWQSNNPAVASVTAVNPATTAARNPQGRVETHKEGEARIIARSAEDNSITVFCTVKVSSTSAPATVPSEDYHQAPPDPDPVPPVPTNSPSVGPPPPGSGLAFNPLYLYLGLGALAVVIPLIILAARGGGGQAAVAAGKTVSGISGHFSGQSITLRGGSLVFGRDPTQAELVYPDSNQRISRRHCTLNYDQASDTYTLVDSSANGTYLAEGTRLEKGKPYIMRPGDRFYLADPQEMFEIG